ncbi:hypothetical protein [Paraburkholderia terrae]|uniref:Uncharacterized protein n=1 Tax=Paraburkholderia terrae TaxID=311230 RepID=A0A2I8ETB0_9BURK|nr:hypothetical protein [Paraburkholderia terrae]AUT62873.1 hypothetical protein C2L65_25195 [Paraburkholderia terrae]
MASADVARPWDGEPDADEFEAFGLTCVMRRDPTNGAWAGYVGVPASHALYRQRRDVRIVVPDRIAGRELVSTRIAGADLRGVVPRILEAGMTVPLSIAVDVHGGLWGTGVIDAGHQNVWFFGFVCAHPWDFKPLDPMTIKGYETLDPETAQALYRTPAEYRSLDYARTQTEALAMQLSALSDVELAT